MKKLLVKKTKEKKSSITLQGPPHPACQLASRILIEALHKPTAGHFYSDFLLCWWICSSATRIHKSFSWKVCWGQRKKKDFLFTLGQNYNTNKKRFLVYLLALNLWKQQKVWKWRTTIPYRKSNEFNVISHVEKTKLQDWHYTSPGSLYSDTLTATDIRYFTATMDST